MKKEYFEAGKIVNIHGLKGEVKVMSYCDIPEIFCCFERLFLGKDLKKIEIEKSRIHKNLVITKIKGIDTPEDAEKLRNKMLYIHRDDLELDEDTYFIQDLIGMTVKDADTDEVYGIIDDILQTGANDVYSVKNKDTNKTYLVPAIGDVVITTDIDENIMTIRPLEGLFDED